MMLKSHQEGQATFYSDDAETSSGGTEISDSDDAEKCSGGTGNILR